MISGGPAQLCSSEARCWADEAAGQQCATTIDVDDLLGLCNRHRGLLRDGREPDATSTLASQRFPVEATPDLAP